MVVPQLPHRLFDAISFSYFAKLIAFDGPPFPSAFSEVVFCSVAVKGTYHSALRNDWFLSSTFMQRAFWLRREHIERIVSFFLLSSFAKLYFNSLKLIFYCMISIDSIMTATGASRLSLLLFVFEVLGKRSLLQSLVLTVAVSISAPSRAPSSTRC